MNFVLQKKIKDLNTKIQTKTMEEIAGMLEFGSPRVLYDWLNGTKMPSIESLYNLSIIFEVKMEDFLVMR